MNYCQRYLNLQTKEFVKVFRSCSEFDVIVSQSIQLSPKGEFLKEVTEESHLFECSFLLCRIHLLLETQFNFFSYRRGNPSFLDLIFFLLGLWGWWGWNLFCEFWFEITIFIRNVIFSFWSKKTSLFFPKQCTL